jgi:DNA modification methylase
MATLPDQSAQTCITSPPYFGLRDYGHDGQIGLEASPEAYVAALVAVFRDVWRVLRDDGTLWLNLGDSYAAARGGTTPPA